MQKVIVIGSPGAGKSTFSRDLHEKTALPLTHLDLLYHRADRTTVSREVFDQSLSAVLAGERWIVDGNYNRTIEMRLLACDTVFFFDLPTEVCIAGIEARVGQVRPDMPWIEEAVDPEFRAWVEEFATRARPKIHALLEAYRDGRTIHVFHSHAEADAYLAAL